MTGKVDVNLAEAVTAAYHQECAHLQRAAGACHGEAFTVASLPPPVAY